jgi:hypothetical protein
MAFRNIVHVICDEAPEVARAVQVVVVMLLANTLKWRLVESRRAVVQTAVQISEAEQELGLQIYGRQGSCQPKKVSSQKPESGC